MERHPPHATHRTCQPYRLQSQTHLQLYVLPLTSGRQRDTTLQKRPPQTARLPLSLRRRRADILQGRDRQTIQDVRQHRQRQHRQEDSPPPRSTRTLQHQPQTIPQNKKPPHENPPL